LGRRGLESRGDRRGHFPGCVGHLPNRRLGGWGRGLPATPFVHRPLGRPDLERRDFLTCPVLLLRALWGLGRVFLRSLGGRPILRPFLQWRQLDNLHDAQPCLALGASQRRLGKQRERRLGGRQHGEPLPLGRQSMGYRAKRY